MINLEIKINLLENNTLFKDKTYQTMYISFIRVVTNVHHLFHISVLHVYFLYNMLLKYKHFYLLICIISANKLCRTRCCTLRHAKNTPTRSFVSHLYISQHSIPENAVGICILQRNPLSYNFVFQYLFPQNDIIPSLVERGLYCNHLVCPSVRLSVCSHFRNRYLSFYWKKWTDKVIAI
jgi:hypothetical protein